MKLIIHRGSKEIGGSCIELRTKKSRIIIDAGSPLPTFDNRARQENIPTSFKLSLADSEMPINGILISHPHQDHYGLLDKLPEEIPVYAGKASAALIKFTIGFSQGNAQFHVSHTFEPYRIFKIGDFTIKPYLMDHSGFDSYAFLITAQGKSIFYSGDFRGHGRKWRLTDKLIKNPPLPVDLLLLEGTMVGSQREGDTQSEEMLESSFEKSFKDTDGIVFVTLSSQNIDRIVTVFRACIKSDRTMVIDPYTAEVLAILNEFYLTLPQASISQINVYYPKQLCRWLESNGKYDLLKRHLKNGKNWKALSDNEKRLVMLIKPSSTREILSGQYFDLSKSRWIYSMWGGYFETDKKLSELETSFKEKGTICERLHTSGHADIQTLKKITENIRYKKLIPIHTYFPEQYETYFKSILKASDGQVIDV